MGRARRGSRGSQPRPQLCHLQLTWLFVFHLSRLTLSSVNSRREEQWHLPPKAVGVTEVHPRALGTVCSTEDRLKEPRDSPAPATPLVGLRRLLARHAPPLPAPQRRQPLRLSAEPLSTPLQDHVPADPVHGRLHPVPSQGKPSSLKCRLTHLLHQSPSTPKPQTRSGPVMYP